MSRLALPAIHRLATPPGRSSGVGSPVNAAPGCRHGLSPWWLGPALLALLTVAGGRAADGIREPAVAGAFYPASAPELRREIESFFEKSPLLAPYPPIALIAPHAGYVFSGQIAADAFHQAQGHDYDLVVILGTNHTEPLDRASVYVGDGYRTPLGVAPIDRKLAESLVAESDDFIFDEAVHRREHSVEVQVPFIQILFPQARILPLIVGSAQPDLCRRIAARLVGSCTGRKVLFVASSDLSHYPPYEVAREVDGQLLAKIVGMNPTAFRTEARRYVGQKPGLVTRACGEAPILVAMEVARKLGVRHGTLVNYATSADSSAGGGDRGRVVGYGAVALVPDPHAQRNAIVSSESAPGPSPRLTETQKRYLLEVARQSIGSQLSGRDVTIPSDPDGALSFPSGVFVTLRENGRLRGCIGQLDAGLPLLEGVVRHALYAAFRDSRFQPVRPEELPHLNIEISVLTPLEHVRGIDDIRLGRDGIVLEKDGRLATFLPQVAVEQHWDREETLHWLCLKAGLGGDCWRSGASLETFQAVVFGESEPNRGTTP